MPGCRLRLAAACLWVYEEALSCLGAFVYELRGQGAVFVWTSRVMASPQKRAERKKPRSSPKKNSRTMFGVHVS